LRLVWGWASEWGYGVPPLALAVEHLDLVDAAGESAVELAVGLLVNLAVGLGDALGARGEDGGGLGLLVVVSLERLGERRRERGQRSCGGQADLGIGDKVLGGETIVAREGAAEVVGAQVGDIGCVLDARVAVVIVVMVADGRVDAIVHEITRLVNDAHREAY
jgi:hypothetical protein